MMTMFVLVMFLGPALTNNMPVSVDTVRDELMCLFPFVMGGLSHKMRITG